MFTFAWEYYNQKYGKVLFTHAGVTNIFKEICGLEAEEINEYFKDNIPRLADVSYYRGGSDISGSPVWADVREHMHDQVTDKFQIFGHTYAKDTIIMEHFAMLDTGKDCFILNDDGLIKYDNKRN